MANSSLDSPVQNAIRSVLNNTQGPKVNVKGISQDLFREKLIDFPLRQYILSQQTDDRAQDILAQHLYSYGTLESIRCLCAVLRRTASSCPSHLSVAERLEQECGLPSAPMALTPMVHNIENQELSESEITKIFETAFSSLKSIYYERLIAVPPKVDCPKLGYVELVVIDRGEERRRNKTQISDFLQTTMQGIDAVLKRLGSINYDEILKFDDEFDVPPTGRKIVISGAPGCGKSTLSRHLCKDLSTGYLSNTYQLIVLVELRELAYRLQEGEQLQLKHMLSKYKFLQTKEVGDTIYKCRGRNILLILDGYDELDESLRSCQFLQLILSASSPSDLIECDVIVTTRPVTCGELFNMVGNPHRHIEILGFKREHIYEYIDKYFAKLPLGQPSCQKLKTKLQQLPHVEGMCRVPVVLEIVCKVYHILGECSIPETQTGIYQEYIISELIESKDGQKVKVADLLSVSEEDFPGFSKLCEKAFECCSKKEQRLLLTEQDVGTLRQYVKRGSMYGLLFTEPIDSIREGGRVDIYYFMHKSIQEMLAAVHIGKLPEGEHEALWTEQFGRPEMAEIWKYYAGITSLKKLNTSFIQEMCSKKIEEDNQKMLLAISLFEASNKDVAIKILPQIFPNGCISAKAGSSYEITALNYCVRNHPSVTSVKLAGNRSIKFGEPLKDLMSALCSLQHLDLSQLSQEDWKILSASILPGNSITSVSLGQVPVYALAKMVSECNLEKLIIKGMIKANLPKGFVAKVHNIVCGRESLNCVKFIASKSWKMSDTEIQGVVSSIVSGLVGSTQTSSSVSAAVGQPLENNTAHKAKMVEVLYSVSRDRFGSRKLRQQEEEGSKLAGPILQAVLKGLSLYNKRQPVMIHCVPFDGQELINGDDSWISSQPELVVPGIKCRLELCLTPEEWYANLSGVVDLEDLEELDLTMWAPNNQTPVNEEELCDAWSKCKCKTVNVKVEQSEHDCARYFLKSVLKGMSINRHVQHLKVDTFYVSPYFQETDSKYQDCLYSLKKLLISRVKCALNLELSPVVWSAILCGVGDAEDLEELDVALRFSSDQTPVNEEELCDAWSKCKCKTVHVGIRSSEHDSTRYFLKSVLKGMSINRHVQHLEVDTPYVDPYCQETDSEFQDCLYSLKKLLISRVKCKLYLKLSPVVWSAILCGVGDAEDLEELDVTLRFSNDQTPVNEEELCDAWSKCKCKTVNVENKQSGHDCARYLVTSVLKGMSINRHVQHLKVSLDSYYKGTTSEYQDCLYSLKKLLISRVKCALNLKLSPVVWSAILCGVGDAEDLEELDVTLQFSDDQTPVNEEELCDAWSKCKCKTVNVKIIESHKTPIMVSLLTAVFKGVARSKASVDFKLTFSSWYSNIGYFVPRIPKNVLNYFTRSGDTFTLKPLETRLSSADCSSNGEPPNKRLHIDNQVPEEERTMPLDCFESSPQAQHLNISSPIRSPLKNSSTRSSPRVIHAQTPSPVGSMTAHSSALLERQSLSAPISPSAAMSYENWRNPTSGLSSRGSLHHLSISPGPQQSRLPAVNTQLDPSMSVMFTRDTSQQTDAFSWVGTQPPAVTQPLPLIAVSTHRVVEHTSTHQSGHPYSPYTSPGKSDSSLIRRYQHRQISHCPPTSQSACFSRTQSPVQSPPPAEDMPGPYSHFTYPQNIAHCPPYSAPEAQYREGHARDPSMSVMFTRDTSQQTDAFSWGGTQAPAVTLSSPLIAVSTHCGVVCTSTQWLGSSCSPHPSSGQSGSSHVLYQHRQIHHNSPTSQSACSSSHLWIGGTQSPVQRPPPAEDQPGLSSRFTNPQNFAHYHPYPSAQYRDGHTHGEPQYHPLLEPTTQALHSLPRLMDTSQMVGIQAPAVTQPLPLFAVSTHRVVVHPSTHQSGPSNSPHPSPGQFGSSQVYSQHRQISHCPPTFQSACSLRTQSPFQRPPPAEDQPGPSSYFTNPQNFAHYYPYHSAPHRDGHTHGEPQYHHLLEPTTQALRILPQLMDTNQMVGTQPPAVTLSSPVAVSTHHVVVHPSTHQSGHPYSPHPSPGQFGSSQVHSQRRQISYCPPTSQSACSSRTQSPVQRPPPAEDQPGPSSRFTHPQNLTHYHPYPSAQYRDGHAHGKF